MADYFQPANLTLAPFGGDFSASGASAMATPIPSTVTGSTPSISTKGSNIFETLLNTGVALGGSWISNRQSAAVARTNAQTAATQSKLANQAELARLQQRAASFNPQTIMIFAGALVALLIVIKLLRR